MGAGIKAGLMNDCLKNVNERTGSWRGIKGSFEKNKRWSIALYIVAGVTALLCCVVGALTFFPGHPAPGYLLLAIAICYVGSYVASFVCVGVAFMKISQIIRYRVRYEETGEWPT